MQMSEAKVSQSSKASGFGQAAQKFPRTDHPAMTASWLRKITVSEQNQTLIFFTTTENPADNLGDVFCLVAWPVTGKVNTHISCFSIFKFLSNCVCEPSFPYSQCTFTGVTEPG